MLPRRRSFEQWVGLATGAITLYNSAQHYHGRYREWTAEKARKDQFIVTIHEETDAGLFYYTTQWILGQVETATLRDVTVTDWRGNLVESTPPTNQEYDIDFNGTPLRVLIYLEPPAPDGSVAINFNKNGKFGTPRILKFVCPTLAVRVALIKFLDEKMIMRVESEPPSVFRSSKDGGWRYVKTLRDRPLDTLFLPDGVLEDLTADIERFRASEEAYTHKGIRWHRGYLLTGPPGTGKSSTVEAVSSKFDLDVRYLSLSKMSGDDALYDCVREISNGEVLVMEDIDVFNATHTRDEEEQNQKDDSGVSLTGLLNVLDGVMTPHGLITILTTNKPQRLDDALMRAGRVDKSYELGFLNQEQFDRMVARFVGPGIEIKLERDNVAPTDIVECLKSGFDNDVDYVVNCIREVVSSA